MIAWILYWLGDKVDKYLVPDDLSLRAHVFAWLFQKVMSASHRMQGIEGWGPWQND